MPDKNHKNVTCENCLSRNSSLFGAFCGEDVSDLNQHKSCSFYKKNQPLFLEGSLPRGVFCINAGKIKIFTIVNIFLLSTYFFKNVEGNGLEREVDEGRRAS